MAAESPDSSTSDFGIELQTIENSSNSSNVREHDWDSSRISSSNFLRLQTFTTNDHANSCCFFRRCYRSCTYDKDIYIRLTLIPTNTTIRTGVIFGVRSGARWQHQDHNTNHFSIPLKYINEREIPIKILVELWDRNTCGVDEYVASDIIDIRSVIDQQHPMQTWTCNMKDGLRHLGQLTLTVGFFKSWSMYFIEKNRHRQIDSLSEVGDVGAVIECEVLQFSGVQRTETNFQSQKPFILAILTFLASICVFAVLFHLTEDWPYLESIYFTTTTLTGVGYGDLTPDTITGQVFTAIFAIISNLALLTLITTASHVMMDRHHTKKKRARESMQRLKALRKRCQREIAMARRGILSPSSEMQLDSDDVTASTFNWFEIAMFVMSAMLWQMIWTVYFVYFADQTLGWWDATYFGIITSTTVGFGESHHAHDFDDRMAFISITIIFGVAMWGNLAGVLSIYLGDVMERKEDTKSALKRALNNMGDMETMRGIEQGAFVQSVLVKMGLVDGEVIEMIKASFQEFERDV